MRELLSTAHVMVEIAGYSLSYIEFLGTVSGLAAVALAARNHIATWPVGLLNVFCFFAIFWQVRLYSDMLLQVYYFFTALYGWWYWKKRHPAELPVGRLNLPTRLAIVLCVAGVTGAGGWAIAQIHQWWPAAFPQPAAYPYVDTGIASASVIANWLLARRKIENWLLWIAIDAVATYIYFEKGIKFVAIQYFIFLLLAIGGYWRWNKRS